jgi:hypothetical protein
MTEFALGFHAKPLWPEIKGPFTRAFLQTSFGGFELYLTLRGVMLGKWDAAFMSAAMAAFMVFGLLAAQTCLTAECLVKSVDERQDVAAALRLGAVRSHFCLALATSFLCGFAIPCMATSLSKLGADVPWGLVATLALGLLAFCYFVAIKEMRRLASGLVVYTARSL